MAADLLTRQTVDNLMIDDNFFDSDDDQFAGDSVKKPERPRITTTRDDKATLSPRRELKRKAPGDALDRELENDSNVYARNDAFDQEVQIKVKTQRAKIPKLDADRLLSEKGIPKIRVLTKHGSAEFKRKLRLKGKGHEFTDCARLLSFYQIWLDNLYPRAKFADALQLVEKAGHSKLMQVHRKGWIDEGKPGYMRHSSPVGKNEDNTTSNNQQRSDAAHARMNTRSDVEEDDMDAMFFADHNNNDQSQDIDEGPNEDELDALLAEDNVKAGQQSLKTQFAVESDHEDELEAFLAEERERRARESGSQRLDRQPALTTPTQHGRQAAQDEDDDLDALLSADANQPAENNDGRSDNATDVPTIAPVRAEDFYGELSSDEIDDVSQQSNSKDEPDLPTVLSNTRTHLQPLDGMPTSEEVPSLDDDNFVSSSPIPNVKTDDLDQLMDEHEQNVKAQTTKGVDSELVEEFLSSSPIPNHEEAH